MNELVYILCMTASVLCAFMLLRGFYRTRLPLLLWSGICFILLAVANILVCVDLYMTPADVDLYMLRNVLTFAGAVILLYGLVWETV